VLENESTGVHLTKAILLATRYIAGYTLQESFTWTDENFAEFFDQLERKGWMVDSIAWGDWGLRYEQN
jgi:hypothetical protein